MKASEMQPGKAYYITVLPVGARTRRVVRRVHLLEITSEGNAVFSCRPWDEGGTSVMSLEDIEAAVEIELPKER